MKTTFILSGALLFSAFSFGQSTAAAAHTGIEAKTAVNASESVTHQAKTTILSQKEQADAATTTKSGVAKNRVNGEMTAVTATPASTNVNVEKDNNIGLNTSLNGQSGQIASSKIRPSISVRTTASSAHTVQVKPVQVRSQAITVAAVRIR